LGCERFVMKQLEFFIFKDDNQSDDMRVCKDCHKTKPITSFYVKYYNKGDKPSYGYVCTSCKRIHADLIQKLKTKNWPPPDTCYCCGEKEGNRITTKLVVDHCHQTKKFRGWICHKCNTGIGLLGDTIEGVEKAIKYLRRGEKKDGVITTTEFDE